jgi:hypothetical protein
MLKNLTLEEFAEKYGLTVRRPEIETDNARSIVLFSSGFAFQSLGGRVCLYLYRLAPDAVSISVLDVAEIATIAGLEAVTAEVHGA